MGVRGETRDVLDAVTSASAGAQGQVVNWLTIVASLFLPLTFITSYFGMNFWVINPLHGTLAFVMLGIVLPIVSFVVAVLMLRFLMRRMGVQLIPARVPVPPRPPR